MKRIYISAALLILTAIGCHMALSRMETALLEMTEYAQTVFEQVQHQRFDRTESEIQKIEQLWQREKNLFRIINGARQCDELETSLNRVRIFVSQKEKSPEALSELSDFILSAQRILRSQRPGLINLL